MTISNELAMQIQADLESNSVQEQASLLAPRAMLDILATLISNIADTEEDIQINLKQETFQDLCEKMMSVINIMGYSVSITPDDTGVTMSLEPLINVEEE